MGSVRRLTDRDEIRRLLAHDPGRFLFELADLDDAAWPHSDYFGLEAEGELLELCLLYSGLETPILVATVLSGEGSMRDLLQRVTPMLPDRFTASLPPGLATALERRFTVEDRGPFLRMAVVRGEWQRRPSTDRAAAESLTGDDDSEITVVVEECFERPFHQPLSSNPRPFFGVRRDGRLVSVAGAIFLARQIGIAAIGPVATRAAYRGNGYATAATARLCSELASLGARVIGLHVRAANAPAIRAYEKLGFRRTYEFESCFLTQR